MSIFIFTDTTADFPAQLQSQFKDFDIMPLAYSLDEDNYDNVETKLPIDEFYRRVKAGAVTRTSMTPTYYMEQKMTALLEKGYDIIFDAVSSQISGEYNGGESVVRELQKKYPSRKLAVIDSTTASGGEALHCYELLKKRDEGATFEELVAYGEDLKHHIASYFTCTDLRHLARLGRCSSVSALIGSVLKIMPVLYVNPIGKLVPIGKVISRKKALKALVDKMEDRMLPVEQIDKVFITNAGCIEDAQFVADLVKEKYGIDSVISDIGPVIGSHTSTGCVAFFFLAKTRIDANDPEKFEE